MAESDHDYYVRRLAEESIAAERAERLEVRAVHEKLARMYRDRIAVMAEQPRAH